MREGGAGRIAKRPAPPTSRRAALVGFRPWRPGRRAPAPPARPARRRCAAATSSSSGSSLRQASKPKYRPTEIREHRDVDPDPVGHRPDRVHVDHPAPGAEERDVRHAHARDRHVERRAHLVEEAGPGHGARQPGGQRRQGDLGQVAQEAAPVQLLLLLGERGPTPRSRRAGAPGRPRRSPARPASPRSGSRAPPPVPRPASTPAPWPPATARAPPRVPRAAAAARPRRRPG